jgi:hypothetical protein
VAPLNAPSEYDPSAAPAARTASERRLESQSPPHSPRRPSFSDVMERDARVLIIVRLEMNMSEMLEMNMPDTGAPVSPLRDKFAADLLSDLRYANNSRSGSATY